MTFLHRTALAGLTAAFMGGCGLPLPQAGPGQPDIRVGTPGAETPRPRSRPDGADVPGQPVGRTADALDRTTPQERAAARTSAGVQGAALGETLTSLGSPTEPGFWLRTGLVTRVRQGRVELVDGTDAIRVELRPSGAEPGAGSQLSLAGFRALGAPLTDLLRLRVFAE